MFYWKKKVNFTSKIITDTWKLIFETRLPTWKTLEQKRRNSKWKEECLVYPLATRCWTSRRGAGAAQLGFVAAFSASHILLNRSTDDSGFPAEGLAICSDQPVSLWLTLTVFWYHDLRTFESQPEGSWVAGWADGEGSRAACGVLTFLRGEFLATLVDCGGGFRIGMVLFAGSWLRFALASFCPRFFSSSARNFGSSICLTGAAAWLDGSEGPASILQLAVSFVSWSMLRYVLEASVTTE